MPGGGGGGEAGGGDAACGGGGCEHLVVRAVGGGSGEDGAPLRRRHRREPLLLGLGAAAHHVLVLQRKKKKKNLRITIYSSSETSLSYTCTSRRKCNFDDRKDSFLPLSRVAYFLPACILRQVKWAVRQILTQKNASRPSSSLRGTKGHGIRIIWDVSHELHNDFLTNSPLTEELIRFFQPQLSGGMDVLCNLHPLAFFGRFLCPHLS